MGELEALQQIGQWASGIGATGILIFIIWRIESGRWKTEGHHNEVVEEKDKSEQRAWEMVEKLTEARNQDNAVLEKVAERLSDLREAVNALKGTIENSRAGR